METPKCMYAIRDITNDEIIWNARGGAYKDMKDVVNKIKRLYEENPNNLYELLVWDFLFGVPVVE